MVRKGVAQRNHIRLALRAFLRLERDCFSTGVSWFEAKVSLIREAVCAYLAQPLYYNGPLYSGQELSKKLGLTHPRKWRIKYVNKADSAYCQIQVSNCT